MLERSCWVNSTWKLAVSVICLGLDQSSSIITLSDLNVRIDIQTAPVPSGIVSFQLESLSPDVEPSTVGYEC